MTLDGSDQPVELEFAEERMENDLPLPIQNPADTAIYLTDMPLCGLAAKDKGLPALDHCANEKYGILPIAYEQHQVPPWNQHAKTDLCFLESER